LSTDNTFFVEDDPCIICQISKDKLLKVFLALMEEAKDFLDAVDYVSKDDWDGGFGFFRCRLARYCKNSRIIKSREIVAIEPATFWSVIGQYFEDIYREGFISIEAGPLNDDYSVNSMINLTRDKLLIVSVRNPEHLEHFQTVLNALGIRKYKTLGLISKVWRGYRKSEITKLLWKDLRRGLDPEPNHFDRFGFDAEGDAPSGV